MSKTAWNKIEWTQEMIGFLKDNYESKTNKELSEALGLKLTSVRTKLYELGYKRMELSYWSDDEVAFLMNNYKEMGDVEIAETLEAVSPKNKPWTLKHIEKKRKYLGLKRTKQQLSAIKKRNTEIGYFSFNHWRRWDNRAAPIGAIKVWGNRRHKFKVIKTEEGYVHYAPWLYKKEFGSIPDEMMVSFKDGDSLNVVRENLLLVTKAEQAQRNALKSIAALSDNYVAGLLTPGNLELREEVKKNPALINLKRKQLQLNRAINGQQKISKSA